MHQITFGGWALPAEPHAGTLQQRPEMLYLDVKRGEEGRYRKWRRGRLAGV